MRMSHPYSKITFYFLLSSILRTSVVYAEPLTDLVNLFIGTETGANGGSGGNAFPGAAVPHAMAKVCCRSCCCRFCLLSSLVCFISCAKLMYVFYPGILVGWD